MFAMLKLPLTLTVSLIRFTSSSTDHLPPFRCDNRGADVHIVPSAVVFIPHEKCKFVFVHHIYSFSVPQSFVGGNM